jgi:hypothetical protein
VNPFLGSFFSTTLFWDNIGLVFVSMGIRNIQGPVPQDRHGFIQKNVVIELISFIAVILVQTPFERTRSRRSRCEKCREYHGFCRPISNNIPKLPCPNLLSNSCLHHTAPGNQGGSRRVMNLPTKKAILQYVDILLGILLSIQIIPSSLPWSTSSSSGRNYVWASLLRQGTGEHDGIKIFQFLDEGRNSRAKLTGRYVDAPGNVSSNLIVVADVDDLESLRY